MDLDKIKQLSDKFFGLDISQKSSVRYIVDSRRYYYKFCDLYLNNYSLTEIGKKVSSTKSGSHHCNVLFHLKKFNDLSTCNKKFKEDYLKYETYLLDNIVIEEEPKSDEYYRKYVFIKQNRTLWKNKCIQARKKLRIVENNLFSVKRNNKRIIKKYNSSVWKDKYYVLREENKRLEKKVNKYLSNKIN